MLTKTFFVLAALMPAMALAQQSIPSFADSIYMLAREREVILQRQIEDLKAKCGDRCAQSTPGDKVISSQPQKQD